MTAALHFTTGAWSGRTIWLPGHEVTIGRDDTADVVIPPEDQRFVSRRHAAIAIEDGRYVVRDLGSSNGTLVNGARIVRHVLAAGDEIRFGRQGPVARFVSEVERIQATANQDEATVQRRPVPAPVASVPVPRPSEPVSQLVRRLIGEAMAGDRLRARRQLAGVAVIVLALGGATAAGLAWWGVFESTERRFRRYADAYEKSVVLVEVGVRHAGRYTLMANGSGFFAAAGGVIVTNKHVVYSHLFEREAACLAESFRRAGFSYENALVVSVWPGGTRFRARADTPEGDRTLGFSTERHTLSLRSSAPDTLNPPVTISCRDQFTGQPFSFQWRSHATDNHDLALLEASDAVEPIPLAATEPRTDDEVMVLGFPRGTVPLETNMAEPIMRPGRVLRTRDTVQLTAVVLSGNSGGPVIGTDGRVVGVATRGTAESLNMAIKTQHVRELLDASRDAK